MMFPAQVHKIMTLPTQTLRLHTPPASKGVDTPLMQHCAVKQKKKLIIIPWSPTTNAKYMRSLSHTFFVCIGTI